MAGVGPGRKTSSPQQATDLRNVREPPSVHGQISVGRHHRDHEVGLSSVLVDRLGPNEDEAVEMAFQRGQGIE